MIASSLKLEPCSRIFFQLKEEVTNLEYNGHLLRFDAKKHIFNDSFSFNHNFIFNCTASLKNVILR